MSKKFRGSYYVDGRRSLTLTTSDDGKLVDIGFRLVHDDVEQGVRGSRCDELPRYAAMIYGYFDIPERVADQVGFRLTRENT